MIIKQAFIIDMNGLFKKTGDIRIQKGKISAIGPEIQEEPGEEVFDAAGAIVTPGFVEIHCRAGIQNQVTPVDNDADDAEPLGPCLRALDALDFSDEAFSMARRGGVTTLICCPGDGALIGGTCVAVKSGGTGYSERILKEEAAYQFVLSNEPRQRFGKKGRTPMTRMGSASLIRDILFKTLEYRKGVLGGKTKDYRLDLHSLMRVFDGMPVKFTAMQANDILTAIRIGDEFGLNYTVEGAYDALESCRQAERNDIRFAVGPLYGKGNGKQEKNRRIELGKELEDHGISAALTTWHPKMNLELFSYQMAMVRAKGMGEESVYQSVTKNPAEFMGIFDRVGSLETGKDADLLIWNGDPLSYRGNIRAMMIDGEFVEI